ncbi:hypothetical protein [Nocardia sp. GTS18]|uniref:hypothetical protein n=1 Tax=Nocardia sp. GTS18 TaxID=1778064 RepID=UPI0015EF2D8F|nr:hypothetical protein [Nocardia sp. GTS18]
MVFNVQLSDSVEPAEAPPFTVEQGQLRYEGPGRAVPVGPDRLRWMMNYRTPPEDRDRKSHSGLR